MEEERVARALNVLEADRGLLSSDKEALLDFLDDYWTDETDTQAEGKVTPPIN